MTALHPVAGWKFYIAGTINTDDDLDASDFSGATWVEVDGWETAGQFGDTAALITLDLINRKRTAKGKGTRNAGAMTNRFTPLFTDAGQVAMAAAEADNFNNYMFKIEADDAPSGSDPNPTSWLFGGLVMGWSLVGGGANTPQLREAVIEINSNIVPVAADSGD